MTRPVLVTVDGVQGAVAARTDGFGFYLADAELAELAAVFRDRPPRLRRRRAGGWLVEPAAAGRPVVLSKAVIDGELHYLIGDEWPGRMAALRLGVARTVRR